jgi:hypothetical protein
MLKFFRLDALACIFTFALFAAPQIATAEMPGIPQCAAAWNELGKAKALQHAEVLVKTDCAIMYKNKWLIGKGTENVKVCAPACNELGEAKALKHAQELVTRNCPVIYAKGWRKP